MYSHTDPFTAMIDDPNCQIKQEQAYLRQYNLLANARPMRLLATMEDLPTKAMPRRPVWYLCYFD